MALFVTGIADGEVEKGALPEAAVVLAVNNFFLNLQSGAPGPSYQQFL